jgi:toxin ParE1/3/4
MKRIHLPQVDAEVGEAALWYEKERAGLGGAFLDLVKATLAEIEDHPRRYARVFKDVRKVVLSRPFPYKILYYLDEPRDRLVVIAILHDSRHPSAWKRRR